MQLKPSSFSASLAPSTANLVGPELLATHVDGAVAFSALLKLGMAEFAQTWT